MSHSRNVPSVAHELSQRLPSNLDHFQRGPGLAVCATSSSAIRNEFEAAGRPRNYFDVLAKKLGGGILLPVDCYEARGEKTAGCSIDNGHCWYELAKFRTLYPEYADLTDVHLADESVAPLIEAGADFVGSTLQETRDHLRQLAQHMALGQESPGEPPER